MRRKAALIDEKAIENASAELLSNTKCPYTWTVRYMNEVSDNMTPDRVKTATSFIRTLIADVLKRKKAFMHIKEYVQAQDLGFISSLKMHKQLYDVLLLEEEIFAMIQETIAFKGIPSYQTLKEMSIWQDLANYHERQRWWWALMGTFQDAILRKLKAWEANKSLFSPDADFHKHAAQCSTYGGLLKWGPQANFWSIFWQWVCEGAMACRNVVNVLVPLYQAKYWRNPTSEEYKTIVNKNIKRIVLPLSTMNLLFLVAVARPANSPLGLHLTNHVIGLNSDDFELDNQGIIVAKKAYLEKIVWRTNEHVNLVSSIQVKKNMDPSSDSHVRMWCPAMRAQTKDGKRMTEQFIEDFLKLLDEMYFPSWDKYK